MGTLRNGTMRGDGWARVPMMRMTNVSVMPGTAGTLEDLIADTDDGIYMDTNRSWSIDDRRLKFQFGTRGGWVIKNGKRTRRLRNPTYTSLTPQICVGYDVGCSLL